MILVGCDNVFCCQYNALRIRSLVTVYGVLSINFTKQNVNFVTELFLSTGNRIKIRITENKSEFKAAT